MGIIRAIHLTKRIDQSTEVVVASCFALVLMIGCQSSHEADAEFSIYLLADESTSYMDASNQDLGTLELNAEPWLSIEDIAMYDFSSHIIYLKGTNEVLFEGMVNDFGVFEDFLLKPFVISAGNQRILLGSFYSMLSSTIPQGPFIGDMMMLFPEDILPMGYYQRWGEPDLRENDKIRSALIAGGVYHGGLDVELLDMDVVENTDTSTIQYTFRVTNIDSDNLYILDPDLVGTEMFHYYTNGIVLRDAVGHPYQSEYKLVAGPNPYDSWSENWYTRLNKGATIQRTILLKGYPQLPHGVYTGSFVFSGPSRIERNVRDHGGGRYWIGSVSSNAITASF